MRPLWVQSHSASVAALQEDIPIPRLRVTVRALPLPFVVIRMPPPPDFATDLTATGATVLNDVPDGTFVHVCNHHPPGPNPLVRVDEPKAYSRRMHDGRD